MKLYILGNNGPFPAANGVCSSYLLSSDSGNTHIIIDCGTGALKAIPGAVGFDKIDAVILSHLHFDHMSDMLPMQYALQFNQRSPLPVYAPATPEKVRALLDAPCFELHPMENIQIGEMQISFLPVRHPVETYALKVECDGKTFVYTGDTNEIDTLDSFAEGADMLLADAGLSEADWKEVSPHLSAGGCGRLAARCGAKELLLTHLNPKYAAEDHVREAKAAFENVRFTEIGAEYLI
ncbi:MAG: MBL fold metallo-hydrolase [Clostridia bacterium]|nr:MBL fold metallo-hydrolase [Clostridia bacterium]